MISAGSAPLVATATPRLDFTLQLAISIFLIVGVYQFYFFCQRHPLRAARELLANIGSNAPYVGLVGTVFGIMVTMHDMISSGAQAGIAAVAPGISEALFATAIGLFVAIPAVWAYNRFTTRVERMSVRFETFADEFSSILQRQSAGDE